MATMAATIGTAAAPMARMGTDAQEKSRYLIANFDREVATKVEGMRRTCEAGIESLRMYLEMEIAKLTKPVLELTMGQFVGEFNGDPLLFFEKQRAMQVDADAIIGARRAVRRRNNNNNNGGPASSATMDATPSRHQNLTHEIDTLGPTPRRSARAKKTATVAETPANSRYWGAEDAMDQGLMTPGMTEQRRTVVLFTPMRHAAAAHGVNETPSRFLAVPLNDGSLVEVDPFMSPTSALDGINDAGREEIKQQLLAMQAQLDAFMRQLS